MRIKYIVGISAIILLLIIGFFVFKQDLSDKFNVLPEQIAIDLEGKSVTLPYNQVWPFDYTQNINVKIISKKQTTDTIVVVIVELKANAKTDIPKDAKDVPKDMPKELILAGVAMVAYEKIAGEWYLIGVEGVSLKLYPN